MTDNILVAVSRYKPKSNFRPLENFTTEAFAWLLRNDRIAERAFLQLIQDNLQEQAAKIAEEKEIRMASSSGEWNTQEHWKSGIPDLIGRFENFTLVIEIKIDADGRKDQLANYVRNIKSHSDENVPVFGAYLTREPRSKEYVADCHLLWEDVYIALDSANKESPDAQITTFLEFLKFENLAPLEPITYVGWRYSTEVLEMFNATNTAARKAFDLVHKKVSEEVGNNLFKGSQGWFDSINSGRSGYLWYPQPKK